MYQHGDNIMTSKVICFASAKGGTGKTITSASLAKFLGALGKNVLLIDMDAATNGLSLFYLEKLVNAKIDFVNEGISPFGIFEATEVQLPTPFGIYEAVDMIPATYEMEQKQYMQEDNARRLISKILRGFRDEYNFIILDTHAGTNIYTKIAIENADEIVIVSEYDPISAEGVERFKRLFSDVLPPEKTWILFNKILPEFAKSLGEFLDIARYLSPIPWDAEVVRALARRRLAVDMEKGSDYTLAIMQTASTLLGEEIERKINIWKKNKEKLLREPALSELKAIEREMLLIEEARSNTDYNLRKLRTRVRDLYQTVVISIAIITLLSLALLQIEYPYLSLSEIFYQFSERMALPLLMGGLLSYIWVSYIYEKKLRKKEKILQGESKILELKLENLKERRKKYVTLVESDLEALHKERRY